MERMGRIPRAWQVSGPVKPNGEVAIKAGSLYAVVMSFCFPPFGRGFTVLFLLSGTQVHRRGMRRDVPERSGSPISSG